MSSGEKKTFVLDTNVLIQSPHALFAFDEHDIILIDTMLQELDGLKNREGAIGASARESIRILTELQEKGSLVKGVELLGGGVLKVFSAHQQRTFEYLTNNDDVILSAIKANNWPNAILVTNDLNMRLKAEVLGIKAEPYLSEKSVDPQKQYKGRCRAIISSDSLNSFYANRGLDANAVISVDGQSAYEFTVNEFVLLVDECNEKHSALARFDGKQFVPLRYERSTPHGVRPRNTGQRFAMEALMAACSEAPLVVLKGPAGTAKTFLSLAVGLEKTIGNDPAFDKILCTRANVKFDEDIGFLKGTEEDKIAPLIRPIFDNLEQLTKTDGKKDGNNDTNYAQFLFEKGMITAQAMAYMRGRSITNSWILVDECQNMTPAQAFGLISRCGIGSKIILVGDPEQIDAPHLDARTNGLTYTSERMKGSPLCWQVTFTDDECVRSDLAIEAIRRMSPKGSSKPH